MNCQIRRGVITIVTKTITIVTNPKLPQEKGLVSIPIFTEKSPAGTSAISEYSYFKTLQNA